MSSSNQCKAVTVKCIDLKSMGQGIITCHRAVALISSVIMCVLKKSYSCNFKEGPYLSFCTLDFVCSNLSYSISIYCVG